MVGSGGLQPWYHGSPLFRQGRWDLSHHHYDAGYLRVALDAHVRHGGDPVVVDSAEGVIGFTSAQGTWKCDHKIIRATTLDFTTAGDSIVRADYEATLAKQAQAVVGTITLRSFPL